MNFRKKIENACGTGLWSPDGRESVRGGFVGGRSSRSGGGQKRLILPDLVLQFIKKKSCEIYQKYFLRALCRDLGR